MTRLADPKDLLLDLSHSLETNLDPEITSSYHHGNQWPAHRHKQNPRKGFNRRVVLDFKDDSRFFRPKAVEFLDEFGDIIGTPDKGKRDQISIFGRKLEVLTVFWCQGERNARFHFRGPCRAD